MGAAWGQYCELCPTKDSDNYNELCLEKGFSVDGQGDSTMKVLLAHNDNNKMNTVL